MSKKYVTIYIDIDAYSFDGGKGHTAEDIENYEAELESALDYRLAKTAYQTLVCATVKPSVLNSVSITNIIGLDITDRDREAIRDLITVRLGDSEFTNAAWEKAWR